MDTPKPLHHIHYAGVAALRCRFCGFILRLWNADENGLLRPRFIAVPQTCIKCGRADLVEIAHNDGLISPGDTVIAELTLGRLDK